LIKGIKREDIKQTKENVIVDLNVFKNSRLAKIDGNVALDSKIEPIAKTTDMIVIERVGKFGINLIIKMVEIDFYIPKLI
jgi:hypothetical protein